jgi:hypothetical protein
VEKKELIERKKIISILSVCSKESRLYSRQSYEYLFWDDRSSIYFEIHIFDLFWDDTSSLWFLIYTYIFR